MNRPALNFIVDGIGYLLFMALVGTGLLLHFRLPPGSGSASSLGLTRHDWGDVHFWIAGGFSVVVVVHLLLHASWIKALTVGRTTGPARRTRAGLGIVAASLVLVLALSAMFWPVNPGAGKGHRGRTAGTDQAAESQSAEAGDGRGERQHRGRRP